jgi:NTE family protein
LAALYCHHKGDFKTFEDRVRAILARGFFWPALRIAFTTPEGIKAVFCVTPLALDRFAAFLVRLLLCIPAPKVIRKIAWLREPSLQRWASRTTILRRVFSELFNGENLPKLRTDRPKLIMVACELQDKSAFYFASEAVGSWRLGEADPSNVEISQGVVASAAYPGLLPALDDHMTFIKNGTSAERRIILTDGGVYDNLGLAPLWPDRKPDISLHVDSYDRVIACRAGYGLRRAPPSIFWPSRMLAVLYTALARTENLSTNRLYDLVKAKRIKALTPYLGQDDSKLAFPPTDLVTLSEVADYPTDFSAMSEKWIDLLSRRGEQMTVALIAEHWPEMA